MIAYKANLVYLPTGSAPVLNCWCRYCRNEFLIIMKELDPDRYVWHDTPFIVCPDCGNKRCPRATYHDHECTQSNKPGQAGSTYGDFQLEYPDPT